MTAAWLWLTVPLVLVLISVLKVGVRVSYADGDLTVLILAGGIRFRLDLDKKDEPVSSGQKPTQKTAKKKRSIKPWLKAAWEHRQELLEMLGRVLRTPSLELLELRVLVGGEDPAACAMTYGSMCAAVSGVLPAVEGVFHIDEKSIDISCSFDEAKTKISASAAATVKIYELVALVLAVLKLMLRLRSEVKSYNESGANL